MPEYDLAGRVIGCAMKVHTTLGPGFLESVYQNALALEIRRIGLTVELERPLQVSYEGQAVGRFLVDMLVEQELVVENKAVQTLNKAHEVQLVNYLTAIRVEHGLLLNFGAESLQFRKKFRTYRPSPTKADSL